MIVLGPATDVSELVAADEAAGRQVLLVTGGVDKHSALVAFAEGLGLADWFGHTYDALVDALRELGGVGREVSLVWDGVAAMIEVDPLAFADLLDLLRAVEAERDDLYITVVTR